MAGVGPNASGSFDLNSFLASYGTMDAPSASEPSTSAVPTSMYMTSQPREPANAPQHHRAASYSAYSLAPSQRVSYGTAGPSTSDPLESQQLSSAVGPLRVSAASVGSASNIKSAASIGASDAMSEDSSNAPRRSATTPYTRQDAPPNGQHKQPKSSSTTALFNTRKNWSQYILESIEDFMHVISTDGTFIFASPSVDVLCGYDPEELRGQNFFSFLHPSDVEPFRREFFQCLAAPSTPSPNPGGAPQPERLTAHYRFRTKDDLHVLFEVTGHFFSGSTSSSPTNSSTSATPSTTSSSASSSSSSLSLNNSNPSSTTNQPKCFFGLARPYPSRSIAMLDSFLELKMENEKLRQELLILYEEIEGDGTFASTTKSQQQQSESSANSIGPSPSAAYPPRGDLFDARTSASVIDPSTGLIRTSELIPSTSNTYGALGIGISANGKKGDGQSEKRRRQKQKSDGDSDLVCRDCGRTDSPEWRKGPEGPRTLCNAC
ncbi:PAS domain-containing GATA-type transcription factor, partial [Sporobolomyces koalae]|uniref:PAS domain-containing GATA-type transcription factor n=1 Tax=Sporobolomyces koalae TaxID=500713 RepID=UPI00316D4AE4